MASMEYLGTALTKIGYKFTRIQSYHILQFNEAPPPFNVCFIMPVTSLFTAAVAVGEAVINVFWSALYLVEDKLYIHVAMTREAIFHTL